MQYRILPKGTEKISIIGLGTSSIQASDEREIEDIVSLAIEKGINFFDMASSEEERDYSVIGTFAPQDAEGVCVYCNHCQPCPAGLNVGLINKYYDLSVAGDHLAHEHYRKLEKNANECMKCGHCNKRCPFHVDQAARMERIHAYFKNKDDN